MRLQDSKMKEEESGGYPGWGQTLVLHCCQDRSVPGLFPGSSPRLGAGGIGNSKNPRWVITAWRSCWVLDRVYHVVLEINARVYLAAQISFTIEASISILFLKTVLLTGECGYACHCPPSEHTWKSSANLIQYVRRKPINQGRLALGKKTLLGSTGTHVCKWFSGMSCSRKGVFTVSAFSLCSWSAHWAILWAEDTRSNPLVVRHPVHVVLHGQCHSQRRLLGKLQCPAEQCFRRSVFTPLAKPCLRYSLLFLLTHLQLYETLKTCFVSWSAKCFSFSFKWFIWISTERTIWVAFLRKLCVRRLLVNLWNYVRKIGKWQNWTRNNEIWPDHLPGTLRYVLDWESGKHSYRSLIIRISQYQHSSLMGRQGEWMVHGSLVWRDLAESVFVFLTWIKVDIHVKEACFNFCDYFP